MVSKKGNLKKFDLFFSLYFQIEWLSRPSQHFQPISLKTQLSLLKSIWIKYGFHKKEAKKRKNLIIQNYFSTEKGFHRLS